MEINEIKNQLAKGVVAPVYVFTGEEQAIMNIYIQQIAKAMNGVVIRSESVASIYSKLQSQSIMTRPTCYVIREDKEYQQAEKSWVPVLQGHIQGRNVIVLIYDSIDKRSKFFKQFGHVIAEFQHMAAEVVAKYLGREVKLGNASCVRLARMCDCDYGRAMLEIDKISQLSQALGISLEEAFKTALESGVIYVSPQGVIFEMIDAVCERQKRKSYSLYEQLKQVDDSTMGILSLLYSNFRNVLLVQAGGLQGDITERTGLTAWQVNNAKNRINHYNTTELLNSLTIIREVEKGIKTGAIEMNMAVEFVLANVL